VLDLKRLTEEFVAQGLHSNKEETGADNKAINAVNQHDLDATDRKEQVVHWLEFYKVLMFVPPDRKTAIADQILRFADGPRRKSLRCDKNGIVSEFNSLGELISKVAKPKKDGNPPQLTSLISKALWCCYPDDVPIFDNNAASALKVISRLCHLASRPDQPKYARFIDVWFRVYNEVEVLIDQADLSNCPYKVRVLDRLLWHLGQSTFYDAREVSGEAVPL
jgi:hypothetical protein